jgi:hypothetical protein
MQVHGAHYLWFDYGTILQFNTTYQTIMSKMTVWPPSFPLATQTREWSYIRLIVFDLLGFSIVSCGLGALL